MGITDPDYLGGDFYKGDTVYWTQHDGQGNDPRRQGELLAVHGGDAWVQEAHAGKVTVEVARLSLEPHPVQTTRPIRSVVARVLHEKRETLSRLSEV